MVLQDEAWACGAFQVARRKAPFRSGDGLPDERLEGCENSTSLRRRDTGELVHGFSCRCHGPGEYGYLIALLFLFGGVFCARLHSGAFCCIESVRSRSSSLDFQLKLGPSLFPWHCFFQSDGQLCGVAMRTCRMNGVAPRLAQPGCPAWSPSFAYWTWRSAPWCGC